MIGVNVAGVFRYQLEVDRPQNYPYNLLKRHNKFHLKVFRIKKTPYTASYPELHRTIDEMFSSIKWYDGVRA